MRCRPKIALFTLVLLPLLCAIGAEPARGAAITRTYTLSPGWNTVYLEIDPAEPACADVFAGVPGLLSVWAWIPRISPVEFIQDPGTLLPDQPQWHAWFPATPDISTLHAVHGGRGYLIELAGAVPVDWVVTGEPRIPRIDWQPDSFNLVGFHLEPGSEPFFGEFFSPAPAHAGQEIFVLNGGSWERVADPATTRMTWGEAVWVWSQGRSDYTGPLALSLDQNGGLHYGGLLSEQKLRVRNLSAADASVALALDGTAPLSYWERGVDGGGDWLTFPLAALALPAGEQKSLRVGARRSGLTPGQLYESNLTITDGEGMSILVPASLEGISHAGLWVGSATVGKVSEPRVAPGQGFPLVSPARGYETATDFTFRLILHVDGGGQVRLLRQVIQMWDGTAKRFVLFSDESKIPLYSGDGGESLERRISSAAFGQLSAVAPVNEAVMSGTFDEATGGLSCTVVAEPDDPFNPFRHRYHPDHGDVAQAYQVTRDIELDFSATDADGNPITGVPALGWGGADMGGIYRETIDGLHRTPILVEGTFLLQRVSDVAQLD